MRMSAILARAAAAAFFVTAALHTSAYRTINALAKTGPVDLRPVVPMVWLGFSLMLVILGLIIWANAGAPVSRNRMLTLVLTGVFAFGAAILQMAFFGFIPPVAILCVDGALAIAAGLIGTSPSI